MIFGTDGIRDKVDSKYINVETFMKLGSIFSNYIDANHIIVSHDTRISSYALAHAFMSGALTRSNVTYTQLPIGSLSKIIKKNQNINGGAMITASHNDYTYNGIKFFNDRGEKIHFDTKNIPYKKKYGTNDFKFFKLSEIYDFNLISSIENVLIDCNYGAMSYLDIKNRCNYKYDGYNINTSKKNFNESINYAMRSDGDGDRVQIFKNGIEINSDCIIATLAINNNCKNVVGTITSSLALRKFCKENEINFHESDVGDINVYNKMKEIKDNVVGGESSGHIIYNNCMSDAIEVLHYYLSCKKKIYLQHAYMLEKSVVVTKKMNFHEISKDYKSENRNIVIRKSGTENLVRIKVETYDENESKKIINDIMKRMC